MAGSWTEKSMQIRAAMVGVEQKCQSISPDRAIKLLRSHPHPVWIDILTSDTPEAREILVEKMGFHELAVEDALSRNERPQLQQYGDVIFFSVSVLRRTTAKEKPSASDLQVSSLAEGNTFEEIGFFIGNNFLVTVASEPFDELEAVFKDWTKPDGRMTLGTAYVAHAVIDRVVDAFFPALDDIEEAVDGAFDALAVGSETEMALIISSKRELSAMRRRLNPTRDVLNALLRVGSAELPPESMPYFRDVLDHVLRLLEMIDETRDMVGSLLDVHLSQVSNNLNVVVKKMTVFATVLMTMALVSGIYGMNFDHMPELHHPWGYPFAIALMFVLGVLVLVGFKVAKWL
jgi:magnesium transporter